MWVAVQVTRTAPIAGAGRGDSSEHQIATTAGSVRTPTLLPLSVFPSVHHPPETGKPPLPRLAHFSSLWLPRPQRCATSRNLSAFNGKHLHYSRDPCSRPGPARLLRSFRAAEAVHKAKSTSRNESRPARLVGGRKWFWGRGGCKSLRD